MSSKSEEEAGEALRAAVMATRFPALVIGAMWVLMGSLSILLVVFAGVTMFLFSTGGSGVPRSEALTPLLAMFFSMLANAGTSVGILAAGVFLTSSGVAGLRARAEPKFLLVVARNQVMFWRILLGIVVTNLVLLFFVAMWGL